MTDAELRDLAVAELVQTTTPYSYFVKASKEPKPETHWGKALEYLSRIGETVELAVTDDQASFASLLTELAGWDDVTLAWEPVSEDEVRVLLRRKV